MLLEMHRQQQHQCLLVVPEWCEDWAQNSLEFEVHGGLIGGFSKFFEQKMREQSSLLQVKEHFVDECTIRTDFCGASPAVFIREQIGARGIFRLPNYLIDKWCAKCSFWSIFLFMRLPAVVYANNSPTPIWAGLISLLIFHAH